MYDVCSRKAEEKAILGRSGPSVGKEYISSGCALCQSKWRLAQTRACASAHSLVARVYSSVDVCCIATNVVSLRIVETTEKTYQPRFVVAS